MSIAIDKGVPLPASSTERKYPFDEMDVGDSFYIERSQTTISGAINNARKRTGWKFSTRKEGSGTRVWRVK